MYSGLTLPTLLALGDEDSPHLEGLIASITRLLPRRFYAHLSPGVEDILKTQYRLEPHGLHYKMALVDRCRAGDHAGEDVAALSAADLGDVLRFYAESYPGNWFEPQMLQTGAYFAKRIAGEIVSVAGVHVYSPTYRVAALGNVATHPAHRGRGHAKAVTGALCKHLLPSVDSLGLNVKADNAPAIRCYRALGFDIAASYEEWMVELV
jgi:ribosomal protein S18 acetylase RimI-like enzyme